MTPQEIIDQIDQLLDEANTRQLELILRMVRVVLK